LAWITPADLVGPAGGSEKFAEIADLEDDGETDTEALAAIARSEGIIKGKLEQRIKSTDLAASDLIKTIDIDMSIWFLSSNRGLGDLELYRARYRDAMALLNDIAAGRMQLDVSTKPTGSEVATKVGMVDEADSDDGGPFWNEDWRDETEDPGGFWDDD